MGVSCDEKAAEQGPVGGGSVMRTIAEIEADLKYWTGLYQPNRRWCRRWIELKAERRQALLEATS